jgi:hypothetical protein
MKPRQLLLAATTRFLPVVVAIIAAITIAEPLIRRHALVATLRQINLPLALGEPLLISLGAFAAMYLLRNRPAARELLGLGRNIFAAIVAVVTLALTAIFSQGAHLAFIIAISLLAGVCGILVAFAATGAPEAAA